MHGSLLKMQFRFSRKLQESYTSKAMSKLVNLVSWPTKLTQIIKTNSPDKNEEKKSAKNSNATS